MSLIEGFFKNLSVDVVQESSSIHLKQLFAQILGYLAERNGHPSCYVWKVTGEEILCKIHWVRQVLTISYVRDATLAL